MADLLLQGGSGSGSIPIPASLGGGEGLESASGSGAPPSDGGSSSSGGWFSGLFGTGSGSSQVQACHCSCPMLLPVRTVMHSDSDDACHELHGSVLAMWSSVRQFRKLCQIQENMLEIKPFSAQPFTMYQPSSLCHCA